MDKIYTIQAKAQRATLKGDLVKAIELLKVAAGKYQELIDGIDPADDETADLVKAIEKLKLNAARRVADLETLMKNKSDSKEKQRGDRGTDNRQNDDNDNDSNDPTDNIRTNGTENGAEGPFDREKFKKRLIRLTQDFSKDTKTDQAIADLRQKLNILKINGNNIDLMTTPEQKLKYENDLLHKIQLHYDVKLRSIDKFYQSIVLALNGSQPLDLAGSQAASSQAAHDDDTDELEYLRRKNASLESEVARLNNRWQELVDSAKKRRERGSMKK